MHTRLVLTLLLALVSIPAWSDTQSVTLSVPDMTCAACPITVKLALSKVDGVSQVSVSYPDREAIVTFDNTLTSIQALTEATGNAGYPSTAMPSELKPEGQ